MPYGGGVRLERPDEYLDWNFRQLQQVPVERWFESMKINCNAIVIVPPHLDSGEVVSSLHESGFEHLELIIDERKSQRLIRIYTLADVISFETEKISLRIDLLPGTGWTRILGNPRMMLSFIGSTCVLTDPITDGELLSDGECS